MDTKTHGTESTKGDIFINQANKDESSSRMEGFIKDEFNCVLNAKELSEGQVDAGGGSIGNKENPARLGGGNLSVLKQKVCFLKISHSLVEKIWFFLLFLISFFIFYVQL